MGTNNQNSIAKQDYSSLPPTAPESSSDSIWPTSYDMVRGFGDELSGIKKRVADVERQNDKIESVINSTQFLQKLVIFILFLLPIIQAVGVFIILFYIKPDSLVTKILSYILSPVLGIIAVIEITYIPKKITNLENKIDKIKKDNS